MFNNGCMKPGSNKDSFFSGVRASGSCEQAKLKTKAHINQTVLEKAEHTKSKININYFNDILVSENRPLTDLNTLKPHIPPHKSITPKKTKILLVEDDPMIQCIHLCMLSELGCATDVAGNAAEALALANHVYDFIFLDIGLPDLDGIEVAKRIRNYPNHINTRIFALTANIDPLTERRCLEVGIVRVLHKPIDLKTLAEILCAHHPFREELS